MGYANNSIFGLQRIKSIENKSLTNTKSVVNFNTSQKNLTKCRNKHTLKHVYYTTDMQLHSIST